MKKVVLLGAFLGCSMFGFSQSIDPASPPCDLGCYRQADELESTRPRRDSKLKKWDEDVDACRAANGCEGPR